MSDDADCGICPFGACEDCPFLATELEMATPAHPERAPAIAVDFSRSTTQDVDVEALTAARVSQLDTTIAETEQALDTLADAVGDYLTAWDEKDAADCAREELCDTNLEDVQRLGRAKARALSALRTAHRATPERPERASSLTVPGSSQDVAVQALTPPPSGSVAP